VLWKRTSLPRHRGRSKAPALIARQAPARPVRNGGAADSLDEAGGVPGSGVLWGTLNNALRFRHCCQTFNPLLVPLQRRAASEPRQALAVDTAGALWFEKATRLRCRRWSGAHCANSCVADSLDEVPGGVGGPHG